VHSRLPSLDLSSCASNVDVASTSYFVLFSYTSSTLPMPATMITIDHLHLYAPLVFLSRVV
jgi:hypothetical protein